MLTNIIKFGIYSDDITTKIDKELREELCLSYQRNKSKGFIA